MSSLFDPQRLTLGTWSQIASPEIIDMVGLAGFEFTIVDCEHGFFGLETAENLFRACKAAGIAPWVRAPALDPIFIGKALDCGASMVVVPGISSAEDAVRAVTAGRFAPEGTRGACPCVRAGGHYIRDWKGYAARQRAETGIALLVETRAGVDEFAQIAKVEGVAAFMLGPFDLSVSMGFEGDYLHPEVQQAVAMMVRCAREANVPVIVPVFSPDLEAARSQMDGWRAQGVTTFVVGTDKILIADQFARYTEALRSAPVAASQQLSVA